jgi:hypothetical protein
MSNEPKAVVFGTLGPRAKEVAVTDQYRNLTLEATNARRSNGGPTLRSVFDWSTVAASGVAGAAGGGVAAWATLRASRRERQQALNQANADRALALEQASAERTAQRELFDETIRESALERERDRLDLLSAVVAELRFNRELAGRTRVNRAFVLFEMDVMHQATREVATLPETEAIDMQEARYAMLGYNALAHAVNVRQPGVTVAPEPPLSAEDVDALCMKARPIIEKARASLESYVGREPKPDPRVQDAPDL